MVRARLHLICGNCGNNEGFKYEIKEDKELGHPSVSIKCPDCSTIHWLDEYADYKGQTKGNKNVIDIANLANEFSEGQITHYTHLLDGSKTQALLYLWLFNHFHTNANEVSEDCGRPMYRKLVKILDKIIEENE